MRRVLLILLALVLAFLLGAGWYAYDRGFTQKWRGYITSEFRQRGVEVYLRQLTLDPLRGLVAKDVRIFEAKDRRRMLAAIDEVILQVNYASLIRGKTFLDAFELRSAKLSIPLDPAKPRGRRVEIPKLDARVFLPPEQIYVARADVEIGGVQISASGRLIHPESFRAKTHGVLPIAAIEAILAELEACKFEAQPPVVSITFTGDLAESEKLFVDFALWGEKIRRGKYLLESLYVNAGFRGGVLDVRQLTARDPSGEMRGAGLFQPDTQSAQIRLRSTLNLPLLAQSLGRDAWLADLRFSTAPVSTLR